METIIFKKLAAFDKHDAMLISIRNSVYGGDWEPMIKHLKQNILTTSYMIKLANKMRDDLNRIDGLMELEEEELDDILVEYGSECA